MTLPPLETAPSYPTTGACWTGEHVVAPDYAIPAPASSHQVGGGHYRLMEIQPVEFITKNGLRFLEGCVIKRVCRHRTRGGRTDIEKAIHELQLLLEIEYPVKREGGAP